MRELQAPLRRAQDEPKSVPHVSRIKRMNLVRFSSDKRRLLTAVAKIEEDGGAVLP